MQVFPKRLLLPLVIAILVAGTAALSWRGGERGAPVPPSTSPRVAVTAYPIYDLVRSVAGNEAEVVLLAPPGSSPHTFEPSPSTLRAAAGARAVYAIGHNFDGWIDTVMADAEVDKVVVDKGIVIRPFTPPTFGQQEEEEDGDGHGPDDPHYWLDAGNARIIARTVAEDLSLRLPASREAIQANLASLLAELDEADREIRDILRDVTARDIVTLHDAWYYFAEAYGLRIVGSFEPSAAREPTPRYLAELGRAAASAGVRTLYVEPKFPSAGLESFLRDSGLRTAELDPIEGARQGSYADIMIANARTIRENQR